MTSYPTVVLVKVRKTFWPAKVVRASPSGVTVKIFVKETEMIVKHEEAIPFQPVPEMTKGKSKVWREAFAEAASPLKSIQ